MGSSGGGGASGAIDFPAYMKAFHGAALDNNAIDTINVSLVDAMNYALDGNSPYAGFVTVDADDVLLGAGNTIGDFPAAFTYLTTYTTLNFDTLFKSYQNTGALADYVVTKSIRLQALFDAESALLDDEINTSTLPQFKAGMRDINAVMSSAFIIGEANIWNTKTKALAKNDAIIRWEAEKLQSELVVKLDQLALQQTLALFQIKKDIATIGSDFARLYATMRTELDDWALENSAKDKLWDVKVFQYGGNFLGSIAGSAVSTDKGDSTKQKIAGTASMAVGGTAAGAYIGAQMGSGGGPIGAVIGLVVGGLVGYFSS